MSVQSNQYLIYGVELDYEIWGKPEGAYEMFEKYIDSAFDNEINPNGLHCLFDGMNGKYVILGRCIKKSKNGDTIPNTVIDIVDAELSELTRLLIKAELGLDEPMKLHLITHYR